MKNSFLSQQYTASEPDYVHQEFPKTVRRATLGEITVASADEEAAALKAEETAAKKAAKESK